MAPPITHTTPATLVIDGPPVPWARARQRAGGAGRYNDRRTEAEKTAIVLLWRSSGHGLIEGPVKVTIDFYLPTRADSTPDLDNLAKLVLDALSGEAFTDDRRVVELELRKVGPSDEPRTAIAIWPADDD